MTAPRISTEYHYSDSSLNHTHAYLMPVVERALESLFRNHHELPRTIFDLGCGNGGEANFLASKGFTVSGVDPSEEGIRQANTAFPNLRLECGSAYEDLYSRFGSFSAVMSLEVVEHVYSPREYARTAYSLVAPGGIAIISTPYHGYLKNLAIALTNSFDKHVNPLWDHGHIKFWSPKTLFRLLNEAGFSEIEFHRVGRIPPLAKSMIAVARKQ